MKKILNYKKRRQQDDKRSTRITNETVAEHRERILAGGRRFKYPVQYARHRLVINTLVISFVALLAVTTFSWWQLYPQQSVSTFFYRIARVLPLPVAKVDGEHVRYSNYLVEYRSYVHYLEHSEGVNMAAEDSKSQADYYKRMALDGVVADAYATKLAREQGISVSKEQVEDAIERQRQSSDGTTSKEAYEASTRDIFNLTPNEARGVMERKLLTQEVAYAIDKEAEKQRDAVVAALADDEDFETVAAKFGDSVTAGMTPLVPRTNKDGGLAATAATLKKGETSQPLRSTTGDGYYIVRLLEVEGDSLLSYAYIKIELTEFAKRLDTVKKAGGVDEYIDVPPEAKSSIEQ